ncbi:MAG: hypothetical protein CBD16_06375 [Betaproteobacteria bacterium TMED156]|nr:MAG: hypothetical protein CBD16_06375 [Betaproteobacteria bacterium TMED156]|tara:strand:- start:138 stop:797 length:660 start_codon:yes stop_codon:yes gene_type:complete
MLKFLEKKTAAEVDSSVIWMHGLGASGYDFLNIIDALKLSKKLKIRFIFPHAPEIPVTINNNLIMPAWYDISGAELTDKQDTTGIKESANLISELIHYEFKRGIPYSRIVLAGFSQGCAMALYTALKFSENIAGIIALSGYLPLDYEFKNKESVKNIDTPIFFGHGMYDKVVKQKWGEDSRNFLKEHGFNTIWRTYKMDHSISIEELNDVSTFLNKTLS